MPWYLILAVTFLLQPGDRLSSISPPVANEFGVLVHTVQSPHQAGETQIRVLLPDSIEPARRYPVIYVLPVEEQGRNRWGDGLLEIIAQDLQNQHQAIFVTPTFSHLPWYADHPTDRAIRQESHFLDVVVPYVDNSYPVKPGREGRLLLGFSKSGWGAWSLLLRQPDRFARAAAWDSPMMMERLGNYGTTPIFGTEENLARYRITDQVQTAGVKLGGEVRLILSGYGNFRPQHREMHELLLRLRVPHRYDDGPPREHDWHSGWVASAVEALLEK
jgi:enterochelin esterase-like enzyme